MLFGTRHTVNPLIMLQLVKQANRLLEIHHLLSHHNPIQILLLPSGSSGTVPEKTKYLLLPKLIDPYRFVLHYSLFLVMDATAMVISSMPTMIISFYLSRGHCIK